MNRKLDTSRSPVVPQAAGWLRINVVDCSGAGANSGPSSTWTEHQ